MNTISLIMQNYIIVKVNESDNLMTQESLTLRVNNHMNDQSAESTYEWLISWISLFWSLTGISLWNNFSWTWLITSKVSDIFLAEFLSSGNQIQSREKKKKQIGGDNRNKHKLCWSCDRQRPMKSPTLSRCPPHPTPLLTPAKSPPHSRCMAGSTPTQTPMKSPTHSKCSLHPTDTNNMVASQTKPGTSSSGRKVDDSLRPLSYPQAVPIPDIMFLYTGAHLGLQYLKLYRTAWWLPHS